MCAVSELFDRIVDKNLLVRRMYVVANHVLPEADAPKKNDGAVQLDLFTDYAAEEENRKLRMPPWSVSGKYKPPRLQSKEVWKERHPQGNES